MYNKRWCSKIRIMNLFHYTIHGADLRLFVPPHILEHFQLHRLCIEYFLNNNLKKNMYIFVVFVQFLYSFIWFYIYFPVYSKDELGSVVKMKKQLSLLIPTRHQSLSVMSLNPFLIQITLRKVFVSFYKGFEKKFKKLFQIPPNVISHHQLCL